MFSRLIKQKETLAYSYKRKYTRLHHCLKSDSKKLDRLHERALRYLYSDESSQTSTLCDRIVYSLVDRRIQNLFLNIWETYLG